MKKLSVPSIIVLIILLLNACATDSGNKTDLKLSGNWREPGLSNLSINNIYVGADSEIYTSSNGVFLKNEDDFINFGMQGENVGDIVELTNGQFLATLQPFQYKDGDTTIYKRNNEGEWIPFMGNYGGEESVYTWVSTLITSPQDPYTLFATGGGNIAQSKNGGESWKSIFNNWGTVGFTQFLKFDPKNNNTIWAGGENAILEPTLLRSTDDGNSWEWITVLENTEAVTFDIAIHPTYSKQIMIGLSGTVSSANIIRRSIDNGETWNTVFEGAGIHTFTHSARNPEIVYASGINAQRQLFFIASADFGETWETIEYPESPSQIYTNDMVSVLENGKEVLYFGTNKGVYSYTFEN